MLIVDSVQDLIGATPIIRLNNINSNIIAKCEFLNPLGSVKDRIAKNMISKALENGDINKDSTLIEATSGNTGIALAGICASLGMKLILTMPESMSKERVKLFEGLGASVVLTPKELGMQGSLDKAKELCGSIENSMIMSQFSNINNPLAHENCTALEILEQTFKNVDIFITSIGTGGTFMGVSKILKENIPDIKVFAIEPKQSPMISSGNSAPHKIQGIGANFIPDIVDTSVIDEVVLVDEDDAISTARLLAKKEGLLVGISSGANVCGALEIAKRYPNKTILTFLCDTSERYLSSGIYD
jgi:cysteine synthase A